MIKKTSPMIHHHRRRRHRQVHPPCHHHQRHRVPRRRMIPYNIRCIIVHTENIVSKKLWSASPSIYLLVSISSIWSHTGSRTAVNPRMILIVEVPI